MADDRGDRRFSEGFRKFATEKTSIDAASVREKVSIFSGWRFFTNLAKILLIIAFVLIVILLLVVGLTRSYTSGLLQYVYESGANIINKAPILAPLVDVFKTIQDPSRVVRTVSWQAEVDQSSQDQELGLSFERFNSIKTIYTPGEKLILAGSVKVKSLKDNSKVEFSCEATTDKIQGTILKPNEPVILKKDLTEIIPITCEIPTDKIKLGSASFRGENVVLKANYDFKGNAYIEAYTLNSKLLENVQTIFKNEQNSRLNKDTRQVASEYSNGPMRVLLNIRDSQPFTEKGPSYSSNSYYEFDLAIDKASSLYQGRLSKINTVYLYLPKNFELHDAEDRFELIESEDEVFNKYQMKQQYIDKLNLFCREFNLLDTECYNYWERGFIIASSSFKVASLNKDDLDKNYIRAEIDYEFQAETSQVVKIAESLIV